MAIDKFTDDIGYISKLADEPNDTGGMTADQLKAEFDKAGKAIQTYINTTLIPEAENDIYLASQGKQSGQQIETEGIADSAITTAKLGDYSVTTDKIVNSAVTEEKILSGAVTSSKLGEKAVQQTNIGDKAVGTSQLGDSAVTESKIYDGSVTTNKIADLAVTNAKLAGSITYDKLAGSIPYDKTDGSIQRHNVMTQVTAMSGGTSYTAYNNNITSTSAIVVSPEPNSFSSWRNYGVRATAQGNGYITFAADVACYVTANLLIFN